MQEIEIILLLLVAVTALTPLARRLRVPYPILLVVGGLILALIPGIPAVQITPELVFLLFLPPLIFREAFLSSGRNLRQQGGSLVSLAVGLVLATTLVVGLVLHTFMPQLGWPLAFALGAIVSPPDAVAAAAVFQGLGVPRRIGTLLEGESLVNDATALVAYRAALGALTVQFSASEASLQVVLVGLGGVLIGLVVGVLGAWLLRHLDDPAVEITLSLLTPFAAYLPAESLGVSGVLATMSAGMYLGPRSPYIWGSDERVRARAVWDMVEFILNGLVFILIGLQLSSILPTLAGRSAAALLGLGALLTLTVIGVRLAWVFAEAYLGWGVARLARRLLARQLAARPASARASVARNVPPSWRETLVVGWAGMRGAVSLAVALSLPETAPERSLLIFLTFFVILATLVGQGLSLPLLIRAVGLAADDRLTAQQDLHARRTALAAARQSLVQLRVEWPGHLPLIDTLQAQYDHRASHLVAEKRTLAESASTADPGGPQAADSTADGVDASAEADQELWEHHLIHRAVIDAQRRAVLDLRERGEIEVEIWRQIERDLDLEELRMDA